MNNSFYIGAYWSTKPETLQQVRDKIIVTLTKLGEIDELFSNWYERGNSREQAKEKKVTLDWGSIEKICLERVKKNDFDRMGFSKMGFLIGLWTGHQEYESGSITFSVGATSKWVTNSCVIKLPSEGSALDRLLNRGEAMEIVRLIVDVWNPEYAIFSSHDLNDRLKLNKQLGLITYRRSIQIIPRITGNGIVYERFNGGHIWSVVPPLNTGTEDAESALLQLNTQFGSK